MPPPKAARPVVEWRTFGLSASRGCSGARIPQPWPTEAACTAHAHATSEDAREEHPREAAVGVASHPRGPPWERRRIPAGPPWCGAASRRAAVERGRFLRGSVRREIPSRPPWPGGSGHRGLIGPRSSPLASSSIPFVQMGCRVRPRWKFSCPRHPVCYHAAGWYLPLGCPLTQPPAASRSEAYRGGRSAPGKADSPAAQGKVET